jgi:predicted nucleotide-binding protein
MGHENAAPINKESLVERSVAIEKLERQRQALLNLQATGVEDAAFKKWKRDTELAVDYVFGKTTRHLPDFNSVSWTPGSWNMYDPDPAWSAAFVEGRQAADALLRSMVDEINEYWVADVKTGAKEQDARRPKKATAELFVVHGRNEACRETVARYLEKLRLKPIILHEQANKGRTIIEKIVAYSDVSFAVILLTADDRGGLLATPYEEQQKRARQNVILELGFFLGRLGRERVCALYEEGIEIPSDYGGVIFVPLDKTGAWRMLLAREIKAAGLPVDMNDVI